MSVGERIAAASNKLFARIRDPHALAIVDGEPGAHDFEGLRGHKYCVAVTYRRSGEGVPTPVWFGLGADGRLYFRSEASGGKVKRIRANGRARVAPSNARGKPLGAAAEATARVLPRTEEERAEAAIAANYGLGRRLYERGGERLAVPTVYVELTPSGAPT